VIGVVIEEDHDGSKLKVINKKGVTDINLPRKRIRRLARLLGFDDLILDARDLAQRDLNKVGEHAHEQST
jgi:hypothetical protein